MRNFISFLLFLCIAGSKPTLGTDNLATVLGSPASEWRISGVSGAADYALVDEEEGPVLIAGKNGAILASLKKIEPDSEVTLRLRLGATDAKATTFYFAGGLNSPQENGYGKPLFVGLNAPANLPDTVLCGMSVLPGQARGLELRYVLRSLPKERRSWPALVRARVEQEVASEPPLAKRWLTLRFVSRKDSAQFYLDDRLLRDIKYDGIQTTGHIQISVFEGSQLASVRVRSLPPENPRFEEVQLDHYLNESLVKGNRIQRDSLPSAGTSTAVHGVPFVFPSPDQRGNDHIDVGRSWMRFGGLEGSYDPWAGDPPRWRSPLMVEPNRIGFRVRNAPYSRLHLIAAFDGEPNKVPTVTAQFFREGAGHPVNFSARVPLFTARSTGARSLPVRLANGQKGNLYLITIPLEPEGLASVADENQLVFELTKETQIYRAYPDPFYYSQHGAGLPSGVHVFALTLERPTVTVDFQPDKFAHIWTAPERPSYTVRLTNLSDKDQAAQLKLATRSHDGRDKTEQTRRVRIAGSGETTIKLPLKLTRYGYHKVEFQVKDEAGVRTQTRSLAFLRPDTRERGGWEEGKGPLWGFWDWNGGHGTPSGVPRLEVAVAAGIESVMRPLIPSNQPGVAGSAPEELAYAEKHGFMTQFLAYQFSPAAKVHLGVDWDPTKPAEMEAAVVAAVKKSPLATPTGLNKPEAAVFFAEPLLGPVSFMSFPEYYGDPPYQMTEAEQAGYKKYLDQFVIAARAIKKEWPQAKCYLPWGISSFPIAFLRNSKEATDLMDGPAVDHILFERLPEMQMHQVTFANVFWQFKQEWIKAGKPWPPKLMSVEGGGLTSPSMPGALTMDEEAEHSIRGELLLFPYGVTRHLGWPVLFACAGAWGEQHYGGGMCERMPLLSPKVVFSAYATMTRQLNRMNYVKTIPTGSASVFCLQFKHYKTGQLLHVLWTLRGKRPVTLGSNRESRITSYDSMDNEMAINPLVVSSAPCYVWGLTADPQISLGQPDHSDSKPSLVATRLGNLGDGSWKLSTERDADYETANPEFIKRFPGKLSVQSVPAPSEPGGKALSVHLEKQEKERKTMPFYTTLMPAKPITITGKPGHLGMWVKAAGDWGRVVYCLRDAKGERWLSVGKKGEWNQDDPNCWSQFCFDGWRYLRFELPGNQPWDKFRDAGTSWWGYYGTGDGIVDLPLSLEKVIVERRTHVIKVDELEAANPEDVLLGNLYAEYNRPADNSAEAIRLSRLEMSTTQKSPVPEQTGQKPASTEKSPFR